MLSTCTRCGKTFDIVNEGDGIHTCTPKQETVNYPWPMDKPIDEFLAFADELAFAFYDEPNNDYALQVRYLLDRLKIAETPTIYTMRVKEARAELLDRGVPEVCDLLAAMERDNSRLTQRVKALETQLQEQKYGGF